LQAKTTKILDLFRFVLIAVAGWMNQQQQDAIDYLREENRILREQLGGRRLRLNDDQRRRLASKAKRLGRKMLAADDICYGADDQAFYRLGLLLVVRTNRLGLGFV